MRKTVFTLLAVAAALGLGSVALAAEAPATGDAGVAVSAMELQAPEAQEVVIGEICGGVICGKGTYCCNPTCSLCLPFTMSCTQQACISTGADPASVTEAGGEQFFPFPTPCGDTFCGEGEFCCNPSCSTCTALGDYCTQQICPPVS